MAHLSPPLYTALREAVATRFEQPLRYPSHCDALEAELQKAAISGGRLSANTLRRFFGLVKKEGGYHLHTLDTLAQYAGHADFAAFGRVVAGRAATAIAPTDIPELLAMQQLSHPERLLLGYFLGRVTRPAMPGAPAAPLALRLAAHPVGQEFFVESFVDLVHLAGGYGEVLATYLQHKATAEAQLFGHATLFLREFLAQDAPAWQARLRHVLALPVPPTTHAFPRGRRAFATVVAAWHAAPDGRLPAALLSSLRAEAAALPLTPPPAAPLPPFYNLFPAGYHFFVAEALFLTLHYAELLAWLDYTAHAFPELATLEHNVYNELLRAFRVVALLRTGQPAAGYPHWQSLFPPETHSWLLDYYRVHFLLAELHIAVAQANLPAATQLQGQVADFATTYQMPFYQHLARRIFI